MSRLNLKHPSLVLVLLALVAVVGFQNCAPSDHSSSQQQDSTAQDAQKKSEDISTRYGELHSLVSSSGACQADSDCKAIAAGSRACGGPQEYVVASQTSADFAKIGTLAKQLTQEEAQYNADNEIVSTCLLIAEPSVACVSNSCVAQ